MRTPLGGAPSLAINESQSRTWENLVGRCRPFWKFWYEPLQETFPDQLGSVDLDTFVRAINRAEPGLIRVDADETTYSLHIILRFELEQELIAGTVALENLPEIWNARMKEFLGIDVPSDTDGVLQDVHWSGGGIGYFPTYALGNLVSLQIWAKVREALPDLDDQMAAGELLPLSDWLRDNLYARGRKLTPKETLARLTGSDSIDPEPYLAYLGDKMAALSS
jgi:carboxypeptidase Taq